MDPGASPRFVAAVVVVIARDGRVLAMRRAADEDAAPGAWETISGRVQDGEDPLDAARREIDEECGLTVEIDPRPVDAYAATRAGAPMVVTVFRARHVAGEVRPCEEHDAHAWLDADAFAARTPWPRLARAVRTALGLPW